MKEPKEIKTSITRMNKVMMTINFTLKRSAIIEKTLPWRSKMIAK